jgi:hypothetical protein
MSSSRLLSVHAPTALITTIHFMSFQRGEVYDPLGLVTSTLRDNQQYGMSGSMSYDELMMERPNIYHRHVSGRNGV